MPDVRSRGQVRGQYLDLALAPKPRLLHQSLEVLGPQVRRQEPQCAQVQGAVTQQVEDDREPAAQASGFDAVVSRVLGQPERPGAVRKQRAVTFSDMELARVELGELADELDGRPALARCEPLIAR
jgi:hypothetical protein